MSREPQTFSPCLTQDEARSCANRYPVKEDVAALGAGRRIMAGEFSRRHLQTIFRWKTKDRGKSRLEGNTDAEIEDALRLAVEAKMPRSTIAVLKGLSGVDTPVASAIATALRPETYTVIDFRALEALGSHNLAPGVHFYLDYLSFCTCLAADWDMSLRNLDRALWQWSSDRGSKWGNSMVNGKQASAREHDH